MLERQVARRATDADHERAGLDGPGVRRLVEEREIAPIQREGDRPALARRELDLDEALELAGWAGQARVEVADVELRHLGAGAPAAVAHHEADVDRDLRSAAARLHRQSRELERGVGEAEA